MNAVGCQPPFVLVLNDEHVYPGIVVALDAVTQVLQLIQALLRTFTRNRLV